MEEITGSNRPNPWRWLFDPRSNKQIEDEIAQELQLHFDLMVESEMQHGKEEVEAKQEATERFGELEKYASECKQIQTWERMMLQKIQVGLVTVLIVLLALSYLDSRNLASQLSSIESQLSAFQEKETTLAELEENVLSKVDDPEWMEIFVCDEAGKPIAGADVQVEWATLDRDRYQFYTRKTNSEGVLHILKDDTVIIQSLLAHKEEKSWSRMSLTQSRQDYIERQKINLKSVVPIKVQLIDQQTNQTLKSATIFHPYVRVNRQSNLTDENGIVGIDWFAKGESVQVDGTVALTPDEIEFDSSKAQNQFRGSDGTFSFIYHFYALIDVDKASATDDYVLPVKLIPGSKPTGFGGGGGVF